MESATALPALVLLAHGSPDPAWREPIDAVKGLAETLAPGVDVSVAFLAHLAPSLPDAVAALVARGHRRIRVVSLFLSPGGNHIKHDIPRLVEQTVREFPELDLTLVGGALGEDPQVIRSLAEAALRFGLGRAS